MPRDGDLHAMMHDVRERVGLAALVADETAKSTRWMQGRLEVVTVLAAMGAVTTVGIAGILAMLTRRVGTQNGRLGKLETKHAQQDTVLKLGIAVIGLIGAPLLGAVITLIIRAI